VKDWGFFHRKYRRFQRVVTKSGRTPERLQETAYHINWRRVLLWRTNSVFIHIPKTAGTYLLSRYVGDSPRCLYWGHRPLRSSKMLLDRVDRHLIQLISILREPTDWYFSLWNSHQHEDIFRQSSTSTKNGSTMTDWVRSFADPPVTATKIRFFSPAYVPDPREFTSRLGCGLYTWSILTFLGTSDVSRILNWQDLLDELKRISGRTVFIHQSAIDLDAAQVFGFTAQDTSPLRVGVYESQEGSREKDVLLLDDSIDMFVYRHLLANC